MTTSGGERFNFIIGMQFQPGDAVQEALRTGTNIRQVVERVLNQPLSLGALQNPDAMLRQAEQIGKQLRAALNVQQEQRVAQAGNASGLSRNAEIALSGVVTSGTTAGLAERARLAAALLKADAATLNTATDEGKARKAVLDATIKELGTLAGIETAERAVERTLKTEADTIAKGVRLQEKLVSDQEKAARTAEEIRARETLALQGRRRISDRAAFGDTVFSTFTPRYPGADPRTGTEGRLQSEINSAQEKLLKANLHLATELTRESRDAESLLAARLQVASADRALARSETALADANQLAAERVSAQHAADTYSARTPFPNADLSTIVGRAQSGANIAHSALESANNKLAEVRNAETRDEEAVRAATRRVEQASRAYASALESARVAQIKALPTAPPAPVGNFAQQFGLGFKGETQRPYGEQLGQAFKFSLFYGTAYKLLFAFTQTLQQTVQEGIAFQQAVTELTLAAGRPREELEQMADALGKRAVEAGFAPSQGVLVGARSLGLYGATQSPLDDQARVADISARVVSRLALGSTQQPADLQANIAAIAQAFGLGAEGQFRIADLDAYMSHLFGIAPGQSIQAVSESATVGKAAGFSQEEVSAIAADIISRTGQTPAAVAGFMAQIFSRGGEGALANVTSKYGIDAQADLATQMKELARVYKDASDPQRAEISAAFGRGKVQNAAIALLQDFGAVTDAAAGAKTGSAGAADQAFSLRIADIGGQIALTTGVLKEFANQLGQSGLLDVLGLGIVVLRELVKAGTGLLEIWNTLDPAIKAVVASLVVLAGTAKLSAATQAFGGAAGAGLGGRLAAGAAGARGVGVVAGVTGLAGALLNPTTLAIAGLYAIGKLKVDADKLGAAQRAAADALDHSTLGPGSSADDYRARAADLTARANDANDAKGIGSFLAGKNDDVDRQVEALRTEATRLEKAATLIENQAASGGGTETLITGFDAEGLSASLQLISDSGGTADDQLKALRDTLYGTADAVDRANASISASEFSATAAAPLREALLDSLQGAMDGALRDLAPGLQVPSRTRFGTDPFGQRTAVPAGSTLIPAKLPDDYATGYASPNIEPEYLKRGGQQYKIVTAEEFRSYISDALSATDVQDFLKQQVAALGGIGEITKQEASKIAQKLLTDPVLGKPFAGLGREGLASLRKSLTTSILLQTQNVREVLDGVASLSGGESKVAIDALVQTTEEALSNLAETDFRGRIAKIQALVRDIQTTIAKTAGGGTNYDFQALRAARAQLAEAQIDQLEALRRAAQQGAGSKAEVARIGRGFFRREVNAAIRGGNQDKLVELVGIAGAYGKRIAISAVDDSIRIAKAALQLRVDSFTIFQQQLTRFTGLGPDTSGADAAISQLQAIRDAIAGAVHGDAKSDPFLTGSDLPGYDGSGGAGSGETAADRRVAAAQAAAARSESPIAQARADVFAAKVAMDQAKKGTVEYYSALASYYEARNALTDAVLDYRNNLDLLSIDMTDPVAMAAQAVRAALRKLRSDRGKGKDVVAADRVALQQAQNEAEATAFQTRLDTVQTAESLGRISHQAYIRYLENESRRLNRIKDRTYQQQQELNQIDQLLKDAAGELDSQFNLGNIKLPTVYQVRRAIEERSGGGTNARSLAGQTANVNSNNTTYIQIDGADFDKVKKLIDSKVDGPGRVVTGAVRRRI